jgi:PAS domain S-box-containing protein
MRIIARNMKAGNTLCQSETRFRLLAEKMRDVIWQATPEMVFTYVSPSCEQMSGYSREELTGSSMFDLLAPDMPPHVIKNILDMMDRVRETGTSTNPVFELEVMRKDGTIILTEVLTSAIFGQNGNLEGYQGVTRDITERRRAEEERKMLEGQLIQSQKMESIGTLAGGIAHDFNNILSAIIGFSDLARRHAGDPQKVKRALDEVLKASERAKGLVSQILAFSRKSEARHSPVDLGVVIRESLKMLRSILPSNIEIRQDLSDSCMVMADSTQIQQVIMNLCSNAADAMENTHGAIEVSLGKVLVEDGAAALDQGLSPGSYVKLTVKDTGHGMSPEVVARIYDPYFTTKEVGRGTGLGLAVVHGILKNHGGSIVCTSSPGKGATFDIYLPGIISGEDRMQPEEAGPHPMGTGRVLFVDDEAALASLAENMLGVLGYEVVARTNSTEALALFNEDPEGFDLVITDLTMPGMTGDRLAAELMRIRHDIPVILCTGYSDHFSENDARNMGIREYLQKPLDLATLAWTVRKAIARGT